MENKMSKQTRKKIQHIMRVHQNISTIQTEDLRHISINGISVFYTKVNFTKRYVRFRRVLQLAGEVNVVHTVAIVYYDEIKSIHVNGMRCIYE